MARMRRLRPITLLLGALAALCAGCGVDLQIMGGETGTCNGTVTFQIKVTNVSACPLFSPAGAEDPFDFVFLRRLGLRRRRGLRRRHLRRRRQRRQRLRSDGDAERMPGRNLHRLLHQRGVRSRLLGDGDRALPGRRARRFAAGAGDHDGATLPHRRHHRAAAARLATGVAPLPIGCSGALSRALRRADSARCPYRLGTSSRSAAGGRN